MENFLCPAAQFIQPFVWEFIIIIGDVSCSLIIDQLEGETDNGFPLPFYAGAGHLLNTNC